MIYLVGPGFMILISWVVLRARINLFILGCMRLTPICRSLGQEVKDLKLYQFFKQGLLALFISPGLMKGVGFSWLEGLKRLSLFTLLPRLMELGQMCGNNTDLVPSAVFFSD